MQSEGEKTMIYFNCDYTEGCHPKILERLSETNFLQTPGYGEDEYCEAAREKIKTARCSRCRPRRTAKSARNRSNPHIMIT